MGLPQKLKCLYFQKRRCLFVFGGQRIKESINDFFSYNIDEDFVIMLSDGNQHNMKLTPSGSSQRATIDSDLGEIYMLSVRMINTIAACHYTVSLRKGSL